MISGTYSFAKITRGAIIATALVLSAGSLTPDAHAAITGASNTITTSRPSASSPLSADAASSDSQAAIFDNGSFYLASDSARIIRTSTTALIDAATIVSSQSANLTTVTFAETIGANAQGDTDVLFVPITAMHHLRFTTASGVDNAGNIVITFPALATNDANNEASPSASTFQFNNLDADDTTHIQIVDDGTDITANTTITATNPSGAGDGGDITITIDTGAIAGSSVIDIYIGCTDASSGTECDTPSPRIINPTKSNTAGDADIWKLGIATTNTALPENVTVGIGTIESVTLRATVDPTLTFSIDGIANGVAVNTGNTTGCLQDETTNSGIASTATEVNLGLLANTPAADSKVGNLAAQLLTVTTNAASGYVITATSSGSLLNPATGFFLNSSTTPTAFPAANDWFGVHSCGLDTHDGTTISTTYWNTTAGNTDCGSCPAGSLTCPNSDSGTNVCKYGWPTQTGALTIAADPDGPVDSTITDGNGVTTVSYAAGTDAGIPAGEYRSIITYVATPTFD